MSFFRSRSFSLTSLIALLALVSVSLQSCGGEPSNSFSKELKALFITDAGDFRGVTGGMTQAEIEATELSELELIEEDGGNLMEGEINLSDASGHLDATSLLTYFLNEDGKLGVIIVTLYLETPALKESLGKEIPQYLEERWGKKPEKRGDSQVWKLEGKEIMFSKEAGIDGDYKITYVF